MLCLRTRLHVRQPQDVKAALEGAVRGWPGSRTSSWLGTLLPLTTFLGAKLPFYFLGEIKINAGSCNPIPNPIWKNQAHRAWLPNLQGAVSGRTWSHDGSLNIRTGSADISFPVTRFLGMLAAPGGSSWAGGIWWKGALDRPEASSASDLLCDFKPLL